jgi:predicted 3-demethylubiquinone-9 3-methyltransferase (glyoxalase superfamily)
MEKVTPFLWFDNNAEEAMNFYTTVFQDAEIVETHRYGEGGPAPAGTVMTGTMRIHGQEIMVLNGGPAFRFNESFSLFVSCEDQAEVDYFWDRLTADGGEESMCGWLKDRFGLSWQIIPKQLGEMLGDPDPERAGRAMEAMLQMRKIDIGRLRAAVNG